MNVRKASVAVLVLCAVSDLAAAPLLIGSDDVPSGIGVGVAAIALLTLLAAVGISRGAGYGRPLALVTRAVDVLGAVPLLAGGQAASVNAAAAVTVALSIAAVVFILRVPRAQALTSR